jgi:hypothetical protein
MNEMKTLKNTLFTCAMIIGLSVTMSAQKNRDQKKPPPKPPAPVINPGEGKRPRPTPKKGEGDKKPRNERGYSMIVWKEVDAA